jgi:hypothetical protein
MGYPQERDTEEKLDPKGLKVCSFKETSKKDLNKFFVPDVSARGDTGRPSMYPTAASALVDEQLDMMHGDTSPAKMQLTSDLPMKKKRKARR